VDDVETRSVATENAADGAERRSVAIGLAQQAGRDCRIRSHEHQLSYRRWKFVGTALNVSAAIFASAAGATLLSSAKPGSTWAVVAGGFGLLSAVLTATAGHLGANAETRANETAAANYSALSDSYRDLAAMPPDSEQDLEVALKALNERRWQLSTDSPVTEEYSRRKIRERRSREDYAGRPLDAATSRTPPTRDT
jgi:hypothetical protein